MNFDRQRWRWTAACAVAFCAVFLGLTLRESWWDVIGVFHMRPFFADTAAILAAGDAQRAGLDVYQPNPFDPFGRPHVYGPWWLVTSHLGLFTRDAWWLGALLAMTFVAVVLVLLKPRHWSGALFTLLLLLSPPVLLGIERGNNDLVIFLLLAGAGALLARPAFAGAVAGATMLVVSAVLKFYPLVALAALLARRERVGRLVALIGASGLAFAALWWMQRMEFFRALAIAPRPDTFLAFGARLFGVVWARMADNAIWLVPGYVVGAAIAWRCLWAGRAAIAGAIADEGRAGLLAIMGGSCWLFCYFANTNYPYRAVLLLLAVPAWLELARREPSAERALGRGWCGLLLATLWLATPRWWLLGAVKDETSVDPLRALLVVIGAEQAMVAALTLVLLVAVGAWMWRRARAIWQ